MHYFQHINVAQLQIAVQYFLFECKVFDCLCLKLQDSLLMSNCHLYAKLSSSQRPWKVCVATFVFNNLNTPFIYTVDYAVIQNTPFSTLKCSCDDNIHSTSLSNSTAFWVITHYWRWPQWSCNAWRNAIETMTFTKLICADPASMYIWGVMGCCIRGGASKASTAYHQFITCDQDKKSQFSFYLLCAFLLLWLHGQQMHRYKYKQKYNYKHKHKYKRRHKHKYKHKHHWTSPVRGRCRLHWGEG